MPRSSPRPDIIVSSKPVPPLRNASFAAALQLEQERHSIEMVRRGIDLSPVAWVIPDAGELGPWTLPLSFKIEMLTPAEVKVAMSLGILTSSLLTGRQLNQYLNDLEALVPAGTAQTLLEKIADAADVDSAAVGRRLSHQIRVWLYPPRTGQVRP